MPRTIKSDSFDRAVSDVLQAYVGATRLAIEESVKKTASETVTELKHANPEGSGVYGSWNDYNDSWKVKTSGFNKTSGMINGIVYNKEHYRLTHLLEFGHALVRGGRTFGKGRSSSFPHIGPAQDHAIDRYLSTLKNEIEEIK